MHFFSTCITNSARGNIKYFNVKERQKNRKNFVIKIEPSFFTKSGICPRSLGKMNLSTKGPITMTCTLQYNSTSKKYILFVPRYKPKSTIKKKEIDCGIDLGCRTFATLYSKANTMAFASNMRETFAKQFKKIDNIRKRLNEHINPLVTEGKIRKAVKRHKQKLRKLNKILIDENNILNRCIILDEIENIKKKISELSKKSYIDNTEKIIDEKSIAKIKNIINRKAIIRSIKRYDKKLIKLKSLNINTKIIKYKNKIRNLNQLLKPNKKNIIDLHNSTDIIFSKKRTNMLRGLRKYELQLTNKVKDMHFKVSKMIVTNYDNIFLGDINTRSILSKTNKTIRKSTKRTIQKSSLYLFKQRLIYMAHKYGSKISLDNEYLTTQTCSNCGRINKIGDNKIYKCSHCGIEADRDENSAKNILKVGYVTPNWST